MKRQLLITTGLAVLMLIPAGTAQARHPERTKCTASNAHTILKTETARIFSTPLRGGDARVYGCLYSKNRRYLLGEDSDCDPGPVVSRLVLRGRYVAFVQTFCNIDQSDDYVMVIDLRNGRGKWRAIASTGQAPDAAPSTLVTDLVLGPTGSVAWIADWDANSGSSTPHPNDDRQVRKLEPGAPEGGTLLDSGLTIEPRSLGIGSRTSGGYSWIYWTKGDSPFATKLN